MDIDLVFHHWLQAHRHPWVTQAMLWVSHWHNTVGLLSMGLVVILLIRSVGEKPWDFIVFLALAGAMLLNAGLKELFQRARPPMVDPAVAYQSFSFPSGHAAGTAAFYAVTLAWLLWRTRDSSRGWRAAFITIAVFMTSWVAAARVVLGVHYLSDVVAGVALGVVWTLLSIATVKRAMKWWLSRK